MNSIYTANFWEIKQEQKIQCILCPHKCVISEEKTGICGTRQNKNGKLILLNYGQFTSLCLDPIEKKPLYHFYPGSTILSIGGKGCNLSCEFCQNWSISQADAGTRFLSPEELVSETENCGNNNIGIAFTYNEPMIWFEYISDCAEILKKKGLKVVLVSNGYINPEPFKKLATFIDAMNIDVKSFENSFYKAHCGGTLQPVLETVKLAVEQGIWVELTLLLITSLNDKAENIKSITEWIANINTKIPLHISRYFPNYKLNLPSTSTESLIMAYNVASEKLKYVYLGNQADSKYVNTYCSECKNKVISRVGYRTKIVGIDSSGCCTVCKTKIDLIF